MVTIFHFLFGYTASEGGGVASTAAGPVSRNTLLTQSGERVTQVLTDARIAYFFISCVNLVYPDYRTLARVCALLAFKI